MKYIISELSSILVSDKYDTRSDSLYNENNVFIKSINDIINTIMSHTSTDVEMVTLIDI